MDKRDMVVMGRQQNEPLNGGGRGKLFGGIPFSLPRAPQGLNVGRRGGVAGRFGTRL